MSRNADLAETVHNLDIYHPDSNPANLVSMP
jgi:hypothetical protein